MATDILPHGCLLLLQPVGRASQMESEIAALEEHTLVVWENSDTLHIACRILIKSGH